MPDFEITSPEGQKFIVTAPEGASQEDILKYAQQNMPKAQSTPQPQAVESRNAALKVGGLGALGPVGLAAAAIGNPNQRINELGTGMYEGLSGLVGMPRSGADAAKLQSGSLGPVGVAMSAMPRRDDVRDFIFKSVGVPNVQPTDMVGRALNEVGRAAGSMPIPGAGIPAVGAGLGSFGAGELPLPENIKPYAKAIGGLLGGTAAGVTQAMINRTPKPVVPTVDELKAQSTAAYKAAEDAGVTIAQPAFASVADDIVATMKKEGFHPKLQPRIGTALDELEAMKGSAPTLEQAELFRRVAKNAGASIDASERRLGQIMVDKLDDFITGLKSTEITTGDPKGIAALNEARGLWSRARKGEFIDNLIQRAQDRSSQFSGSGYENALRTEFRNVLMNSKKLRMFNEAEVEAIRQVAKGGPVENTLRMAGKLAPTGVISSALSGGMGALAGNAFGMPAAGAIGLPMLGAGARQAATVMTEANAQRASELMRSAGLPLHRPMTPSELDFLRALLVGGSTGAQQLTAPGTN